MSRVGRGRKREVKMKRLLDMFKQIPLISGFLAVIGLTSYLIVMILRSIVRALGVDFVSTEQRIVVGMLISTAACFAICYTGLRRYLRHLGENDAAFLRSTGEKAAPSLFYAFLTCCGALGAYGAVLLLLNFYHWNFFEGPVFYLSFAFYSIPEKLYADTTVDFVFVWCEVLSFGICGLFYLPAMLKGYLNGFKKSTEEN